MLLYCLKYLKSCSVGNSWKSMKWDANRNPSSSKIAPHFPDWGFFNTPHPSKHQLKMTGLSPTWVITHFHAWNEAGKRPKSIGMSHSKLPCCVHAPHLFTEILQMAQLAKSNLKIGYYQPIYILKMCTIVQTVFFVCSCISVYVYYMYISLKCIQQHVVLCQGCSSQISWRYSTRPLWKPIKVICLAFFRHGLPKQLSSASFVAFNASRRNSSRLPQWRKATLRNLRRELFWGPKCHCQSRIGRISKWKKVLFFKGRFVIVVIREWNPRKSFYFDLFKPQVPQKVILGYNVHYTKLYRANGDISIIFIFCLGIPVACE